MIYGELGLIPISVQAKCRLLNRWAKLVDGTECKLSNIFYYLLYKMDEPVFFTSNWIRFVKSNLNALGFSELYTAQNIPYSSNCFKNRVQLRTKDLFRQNWASEVFDSSMCLNYRMFKTNFEYENYLTILEDSQRIVFTKFRCRNHKLPIETGSHNNIPRQLRICQKCNSHSIGDEFHYLFVWETRKSDHLWDWPKVVPFWNRSDLWNQPIMNGEILVSLISRSIIKLIMYWLWRHDIIIKTHN